MKIRGLWTLVILAFALTGTGCSSSGMRSALPRGQNGVQLPTPQSISPGLISPAPMAKTAILPPSAMQSPHTITTKSDIQGMNYTAIPGSASYAAAAPDGSLWVLSTQPAGSDKYIWHYSNGTWTNIPGLASRITVAPNGTMYALNSGGGAYAYSAGSWTAFGGGCRDLTAASDGSLYVISNAGGADGAIWHYASGGWTQSPGSGNRLAASWDTRTFGTPSGTITPGGFYVINSVGGIYYLGASGYIRLPGAGSAVAPIAGGIFALGYPSDPNGSALYYFDLQSPGWTAKGGGGVSVSSDGSRLYVVGADGTIYQSNVTVSATPKPGTIAVQASSYQNEKMPNVGPQTFPNSGDARAYADFFQDGHYALFMATLESATSRGHLYFYQNVNGAWVDKTSQMLTDNTGCFHPRKAIVADFNGDAKPDIFVACHGIDSPPYSGEQPIVLLSQPDGTYKATMLPYTGYFHGAAAAELTAKGYADILVVDTSVAKTPYFLMNNHDGTFRQDFSRLPPSLLNRQIYTAELIDFDNSGKYDAFLSGTEPNSQGTPDPCPGCDLVPTIFKNSGYNYFTGTTVALPSDPAYGQVLDIVYQNGAAYLLRVINAPGPTFYSGSEVQKVTYPGLAASVLYTHTGSYPSGTKWIRWLVPYNGLLVSDDAATPASITP